MMRMWRLPKTRLGPALRQSESTPEGRGESRLSARFPLLATAFLVFAAALMQGGTCTHSDSPPPEGPVPPTISITLNAVPDPMNDLLVVPPTGFVINVSYQPNDHPIKLASLLIVDEHWSGTRTNISSVSSFSIEVDRAVWVVPSDFTRFPPGTHTLAVFISDVHDNFSYNTIDFAVREFPGSPPIDTGQKIWFDFDHDPARDFSADLEAFGLGSPSAPSLSAKIESEVIAALLDRVALAYHEQDPNGLGQPDPVAVDFFSTDPGAGEVTRVCVGGEDPSGGSTIGNILIDPNNARRSSVECGSLPPTGVFPGELLVLQSDPTFQETFDPLRPSRGGTPVGEHPLDPIVLDDLFDPESASAEERERYDQIYGAVDRFGAVLGSIMAHEVGHALGLVPAGAPGMGLYGGSSGARFAHAVTPEGGDPPENYLMKAGNTFTFSKLGGLNGHPLPTFRPLSFAYLRDRVLAYVPITELLPPPEIDSVDPAVIDQSAVQITIIGSGFAGTPAVRLLSESFVYHVVGETLVSDQVITGWVIRSQILPGAYDLEITNSDGQTAVLADAVVVP
jgi:hypothetical protein